VVWGFVPLVLPGSTAAHGGLISGDKAAYTYCRSRWRVFQPAELRELMLGNGLIRWRRGMDWRDGGVAWGGRVLFSEAGARESKERKQRRRHKLAATPNRPPWKAAAAKQVSAEKDD
jgi:hypothetical protein